MTHQPIQSRPAELNQLHASTCMSMTQFINGHHCPKLAYVIIQQLNRLLVHPDVEQTGSREMYQQLLEHWQQITVELLGRKSARQLQFH